MSERIWFYENTDGYVSVLSLKEKYINRNTFFTSTLFGTVPSFPRCKRLINFPRRKKKMQLAQKAITVHNYIQLEAEKNMRGEIRPTDHQLRPG